MGELEVGVWNSEVVKKMRREVSIRLEGVGDSGVSYHIIANKENKIFAT